MKKIFIISAFLLSVSGSAFSAQNEFQSDEFQTDVFERFDFAAQDLDSTTAFLNIESDDCTEVDVAAPAVGADDIIAYAMKYLGRPYRSGAKGPKAFDCSGFTSFVYRNFDISLSPSSSQQSVQGVKVAKADIQPGDLLFFKGRRNSGVGHVGIAVDVDDSGNVSFIHAATSSGIRIDKLNDAGYYQKRYVGARRVLD